MGEKKAIRVAYGEALAALGAENDKVVALDADLAHATMSATFADKFPERFFNAGIAEANMIDMAAGLSTMGYIPFASTFAVFSGRCFEQIRNGVAYPHFNVKFGMTHAGITLGEDGGTRHDIALAVANQRLQSVQRAAGADDVVDDENALAVHADQVLLSMTSLCCASVVMDLSSTMMGSFM